MFLTLPQADFLKGFCAIYKVFVAPTVLMSLFKMRNEVADTLFKTMRIEDLRLIFYIIVLSKDKHNDI